MHQWPTCCVVSALHCTWNWNWSDPQNGNTGVSVSPLTVCNWAGLPCVTEQVFLSRPRRVRTANFRSWLLLWVMTIALLTRLMPTCSASLATKSKNWSASVINSTVFVDVVLQSLHLQCSVFCHDWMVGRQATENLALAVVKGFSKRTMSVDVMYLSSQSSFFSW